MRQRYREEKGVDLPAFVPSGPDNPLGGYALRIGTSQYLIHGTNQRAGIGLRASSGCIRMYAHDIEWLFANVRENTPLRIIDQPIKMSYEPSGEKWIEVHEPLSELDNSSTFALHVEPVKRFIANNEISRRHIQRMINKPTGLATVLKQ